MSASEMMMLEEELDELRSEVEKLRAEREHFREAWAVAQARLDCGADAAQAVREDRVAVVAWLREVRDTSETAYASDDLDYAIAVIERGGHRSEVIDETR
jgi:predicted ATPase